MRETLVRQGIDRLDSALSIVDTEGVVVYTNEAWEALALPGTVPAAVTTGEEYLPACESISDAARATTAVRREFEALLAGRAETARSEYPCPRPDELPRWFRLRGWPFATEDGEFVIVEHVEITDQRRTERTLEHRTETLADVASVVSHDIRSPLTAARSWVELLEADPDTDTEKLDRIVSSLDRMDTIIDAAVALARETSLGQVEPVDPALLATAAWEEIDHRGSELVVEDIDTCPADEEMLELLFEHLLRNAVEHGSTSNRTRSDDEDGGGVVTVRVGPLADGFYVEDDGVGISTEMRDQIFDPGITTRASDSNAGLGLTVAERIAAAHDWDIALADADTGGARFEITGILGAA